jgi:hypothetical protein
LTNFPVRRLVLFCDYRRDIIYTASFIFYFQPFFLFFKCARDGGITTSIFDFIFRWRTLRPWNSQQRK